MSIPLWNKIDQTFAEDPIILKTIKPSTEENRRTFRFAYRLFFVLDVRITHSMRTKLELTTWTCMNRLGQSYVHAINIVTMNKFSDFRLWLWMFWLKRASPLEKMDYCSEFLITTNKLNDIAPRAREYEKLLSKAMYILFIVSVSIQIKWIAVIRTCDSFTVDKFRSRWNISFIVQLLKKKKKSNFHFSTENIRLSRLYLGNRKQIISKKIDKRREEIDDSRGKNVNNDNHLWTILPFWWLFIVDCRCSLLNWNTSSLVSTIRFA